MRLALELGLLYLVSGLRGLTNATPHERLFAYERRSVSGRALPTWLLQL